MCWKCYMVIWYSSSKNKFFANSSSSTAIFIFCTTEKQLRRQRKQESDLLYSILYGCCWWWRCGFDHGKSRCVSPAGAFAGSGTDCRRDRRLLISCHQQAPPQPSTSLIEIFILDKFVFVNFKTTVLYSFDWWYYILCWWIL